MAERVFLSRGGDEPTGAGNIWQPGRGDYRVLAIGGKQLRVKLAGVVEELKRQNSTLTRRCTILRQSGSSHQQYHVRCEGQELQTGAGNETGH